MACEDKPTHSALRLMRRPVGPLRGTMALTTAPDTEFLVKFSLNKVEQ
jgi:hypothetical protein